MLKENKRNYIHLYIDVSDEVMYFHSTSTSCRLGKSLLDFIYTDLEQIRLFPELLRELHPYFIHFPDESIRNILDTKEEQNALTFEQC